MTSFIPLMEVRSKLTGAIAMMDVAERKANPWVAMRIIEARQLAASALALIEEASE